MNLQSTRHLLIAALTFAMTAQLTCAQSLANWEELCRRMVAEEVAGAGIENKRVIEAIEQTPRHEFVLPPDRRRAYLDMALPIGNQQTISPPFVVAYMTEQLDPQPSDRVLEIGTGSGYQAAVLSPLVRDVYSIEIVAPLGRKAARTLRRLKYRNVHTKIGDGYLGWPDAAPFDKIIVTCSPEKVPTPLIEQLREGGLMIVPVGERFQQNLYLFRKKDGQLEREKLQATLFVPMTGKAEDKREVQPDPLRPEIANGSFEELIGNKRAGKEQLPAGWHYLRLAKIVTDKNSAPQGERYLQFANEEPGQGCRALQGFAIDGRKVSQVQLKFFAKAKNIRYGQNQRQWPYVVITFYDERRATLDHAVVGPLQGSFDWTKYDLPVDVPLRAREAIIRIGLLGAIGELAIDHVRLEVPQTGSR